MGIDLNHLSDSGAAGEAIPSGTPAHSGPRLAPRLGRKRDDPSVLQEQADAAIEATAEAILPMLLEEEAMDAANHQLRADYASERALAVADDPVEPDPPPPSVSTVGSADVAVGEPDLSGLDVAIPEILLVPNSFLCGPAGTGKTFLARSWVRQHKGTVLAATTGIAAINLGEGTTINALLGYFDTASLTEAYTSGFLGMRLGKLWRAGIRRILLDEVSMLDAEQLTIITRACDELAGRGFGVLDAELMEEIENREEGEEDPLSLTVIGDFAQLPPVKAPFAFESPEWGRYAAHSHQLTTIRRQADREFIEALQAARRGDHAAVIAFFGPGLQRVSDPHFDGTTIFGTNDAVARYNQLRMDKIVAPVQFYKAERWGEQRTDWKHIPDQLALKVGALVMVLANERMPGIDGMPGPLIYANGDLATVVECRPAERLASVKLHRNGRIQEIQWVERKNTIPLAVGRRKELKAERKEHLIDGRFEIIGTVMYLPLRLAWGTTVHKSQGLSLDKVQVNTNEGMFKQPGLLYVALSRARTAEGLRIVGSVEGLRTRCTVHGKVQAYL